MAPRKPIKTYTRKSSIIPLRKPQSVEVFDALFAINLSKRIHLQTSQNDHKKPIIVKELPSPDENHHLLHDSASLSFINEDTFDKLKKETPVRNVYYKPPLDVENKTGDLDSLRLNSFSNDKEVKQEPSFESIVFQNAMATRTKRINTLPKYFDESVNESLYIELENDKDIKPKDLLSFDGSEPKIERPSSADLFQSNIFSDTFKNAVAKNMPVIASTPGLNTSSNLYVLHETISPIIALKRDNSMLLQSYKEISEWSYRVPNFEYKTKAKRKRRPNTKFKSQPRITLKRKFRENSTLELPQIYVQKDMENDWKLNGKAVVQLEKCLNSISIHNSTNLDNLSCEGWPLSNVSASKLVFFNMKTICDIYERRLAVLSANFMSTYKRNAFCKSPSLEKSCLVLANDLRDKSDTNLSYITKEDCEDKCLNKSKLLSDNSLSLFSSESSQLSISMNLASPCVNEESPICKLVLDENKWELEIPVDTLTNLRDTSLPSHSSTPIRSSRKRPILIEFEKSLCTESLLQNIGCDKNTFENISKISNSCSNIDIENALKNISKINDVSIVTVSDEEDSVTKKCTNNSFNVSHIYSKNFYESIPVIDLTKESEIEDILYNKNSNSMLINNSDISLPTESSIAISSCSTSEENLEYEEEAKDQFSFSIPRLSVKKLHKHDVLPGKLFRRSLLHIKRFSVASINCERGRCSCCQNCKLKTSEQRKSFYNRRISVRVLPEKQKIVGGVSSKSILENYASSYIENSEATEGKDTLSKLEILEETKQTLNVVQIPSSIRQVTACDVILQRCEQLEAILFENLYTPSILKDCRKLGEGVYGEVFEYINLSNVRTVMKIIPIEGDKIVNGEHQKKYEEIISEIIICMELSNLRNGTTNKTSGFSEVYRIRCVRGCYPPRLLELWAEWDNVRHSENDSPKMFESDQLYIILELAHGGVDMEEYVFKNSAQALSLFKQMAFSLAVAENTLKFEHRDLHWGNVLISTVDPSKSLTFYLEGSEFTMPSCGVEGSIIDFTLSRITYDGVCIYNDLSLDPELFEATGDYQFDIYRLMQKANGDSWSEFNPYTNVLWLHYTVDKMISELNYRYIKSKLHTAGIKKLYELKNVILDYKSVGELVVGEFLS